MGRYLLVLLAVSACGDQEVPGRDAAVTPPMPSIVVPTSLIIVEGETTTFSVKLAEAPSDSVSVQVMPTATGAVTVSPSVITFDSATTQAEVTVSGIEDDDNVINETLDLVLSTDGGDTKRVPIRVIDNDVQQIIASTTNLAVRESEAALFTIRLVRRPSDPVTVTVWSDAPETASVSPATVTFDPTHYDVPAIITITGVSDADTANGAAHVYAGKLSNVTNARVDVAVNDDDVQALLLSATNVPVGEGAASTFTVRLAFDPVQSAVVTLQSSDASAAAIAGSASLPFDSTNYDVPQIVTLAAAEDADASNESVTITLSGAASGTVSVPVTDNDLLSVQTSPVTEGRSSTFYVALADSLPAPLPTTVEVLSGDVTVSPSSFFVSDPLIATDFTVTAGVDASSNTNRSALIRISAPGQTSRDIPITIVDRIPGTLTPLFLRHEDPRAGALGYMDLTFQSQSGWPGDGRLVITYPTGFDVAGATFQSSTADGSYAVTASGSTVTIARSNGTTTSSAVTVRLGSVRNPPVSGSFPILLWTQTSAGDPMDTATANDSVYAAAMPSATATLANSQPAVATTLTFAFVTRNPWPADGTLTISFPTGLDIASSTLSAQSGIDGTLGMSISGTLVTLSRSGGTAIPGGISLSITLANVVTSPTARSTDPFQLVTHAASGAWIDVGAPRGVAIGCPTTITRAPLRGTNVPFGGDAWQYPDGVTSPTWGTDVAHINSVQASDYLVASDFEFALPAGATISGISFYIERDYAGYNVVDSAMRVVKATVGQTDRSSATPWTTQPAAYGGPSDLWGETWSAADIESNSFGLAMAVKAVTPGMGADVRVNYVTATVYLSCP